MRFLQANSAVSLDRTREQWVDLGIMKKACITRPETCGTEGGSVAFWLRVIHRGFHFGAPGVISSRAHRTSRGIVGSVSTPPFTTKLRYVIPYIVS